MPLTLRPFHNLYSLYTAYDEYCPWETKNPKSVYIEKSSTCRTEVFSLVALYCSNGYIILRYAGPSNDTRNVLPILRYIPWCVNNGTEGDNDAHHSSDGSGVIKGKGYNHTVKALCFNDNGKQLFVLCEDGSVYCLPALSIVMETNPSVKVSELITTICYTQRQQMNFYRPTRERQRAARAQAITVALEKLVKQ